VLDHWFEARDSAVDILVLVPWFEYGTRTRMSTDGWLEPQTMDLNGTKKLRWLEPQTMDLNGTKKLRNISRLNLFLIKFHIIFLLSIKVKDCPVYITYAFFAYLPTDKRKYILSLLCYIPFIIYTVV
jgi:hypothetical protein